MINDTFANKIIIMIKITRVNTTDETFPFVEELLQNAFPLQERRDSDQQRCYTDCEPLFHCNVIKDDCGPVGLLNYWDFGGFIYIEHFAISPTCRNRGYGAMALETIIQQTAKPLVLEVEEPTDDLSRRRISFYQRNGFRLEEQTYQQPPYREEDGWLPMKLMTLGIDDIDCQFHEIKRFIYCYVYNV